MLDIVWIVQFLGLAVSVPSIVGLVGVCHRLLGRLWPFVYLFFLYCSSSLLTWRALFEAAWLSKAVLVFLLTAITFGLPHVSRIFVSSWRNRLRADFGALDRWCQAAVLLMAAAVLTDVLYAAFPGYRYDQLNYHLVTPKLVDAYGVLPPFISTDHTHFTGNWEYFFTSLRVLVKNDLWVQTTTTSFTFLSYVIPTAALLWQLISPSRYLSLWLVGLPAAVIYMHVELEPGISAKPDFINAAAAMALVAAQRLPLNQRIFFSFFFLAAGLSFKLTWIPAAASFAVAVLWMLGRVLSRQTISQTFFPAAVSIFIAAGCLLPFFFKNYLFFENPLHPTQAGPFQSNTATPVFLTYWEQVSNAPKSFSAAVINILKVLARYLSYYFPVLPSLLLAAFVVFRKRRPDGKQLFSALPWTLACAVYLALWGILFENGVSSRFVVSTSVFILLLLVYFLGQLSKPRFLALAMIMPVVLNSAVEVKLRQMFKGFAQTYVEYSVDNFSGAVQDFREARLIEEHAIKTFGAEWSKNCFILGHKANHYYFNSRFVSFADPVFEFHVLAFGKEKFRKCPWAYFQSVRACYLVATDDLEFSSWPEPFQQLVQIADADLATGVNKDLRVRFVSPETLAAKLLASNDCLLFQPADGQPHWPAAHGDSL